jgi:arylsulfatase A
MKRPLTFITVALFCGIAFAEKPRPNVLFIAVDDLNDWVGCLGGHPQAKTPNIDRLAGRPGHEGTVAELKKWLPRKNAEHFRAAARTGPTVIPVAKPLPQVETRSPKTNIILIMADDIGYECYGAFGGTSYRTPELDKIAARGMLFPHAYSNPICTPTRVKIMTGLSNVRNYVAFSILKKGSRTFGHMMREAGYRTAIAGKWQLLGAEHYPGFIRGKGSLPQHMGFDRHCLWQVDKLGSRFWEPTITIDGEVKKFGKDVYGPDVYAQFLLDRMEEYRDEPFFLYYPMALVHSPFVPTPDSANRNGMNKQQNFADMVAYMDKLIGRIVARTEQLGIAERTLILFAGDNGTHPSIRSRMGGKVIAGGKGKTTDAGTRVGLFAYQPGTVPAGRVSRDLIEFSDFVPTIAEATGARPLLPVDGQSFLPQLHGAPGHPRDSIYVYYWPRPEKGRAQAFVRNQRWKLYADGRLIDVQNDVLEKNPVSGPETAPVRKHLQADLDRMPGKGQTLLRFD